MRQGVHAVKQMMRRTINNLNSQFDQTMLQMIVNAMGVAEFYSPPRIASMGGGNMGFRAAWSMDTTIHDTDGRAWDFNSMEMRNRAARIVLQDTPFLPTGSPVCIAHSIMNDINHSRMAPELVKARFAHARKHLEFAAKLYKLQIQEGRHLLHEHPESASPWYERCIDEIVQKEGAMSVMGDQCCYVRKARGGNGDGPARNTI